MPLTHSGAAMVRCESYARAVWLAEQMPRKKRLEQAVEKVEAGSSKTRTRSPTAFAP